MIKKYLEYINESTPHKVDIRKIMSVEDIEDQLLRLKEVLNCEIQTEVGHVLHGMHIDKYYIQWDDEQFPTRISFVVEPPYESIYEKNIPNMNYKLFPNSEDINKENININNKVSEEVDDIVRRIKSMNPELYVHLTKNNPWNHIWLNNTNLKTYNIIISTSKLSTK